MDNKLAIADPGPVIRHPHTNSKEAEMNERDLRNSPGVLDRRSFLITSAGTIAWLAMGGLFRTSQAASLHVLPPLPYANNALEPAISAGTIGFHYGKHHRGYVDNLNTLNALGARELQESDDGKRMEIVYNMQTVLADDVPAIPLYYTTNYDAWRISKYDGWMNMYDHHARTHSILSYLERDGIAEKR